MKAKVLIVGYGVVGKRIADAVHLQDDMEVRAIVDVVPTSLVRVATDRGFPLFGTTSEVIDTLRKAGFSVEGDLTSALRVSDIVVDTSPEGVTPRTSRCTSERRSLLSLMAARNMN